MRIRANPDPKHCSTVAKMHVNRLKIQRFYFNLTNLGSIFQCKGCRYPFNTVSIK